MRRKTCLKAIAAIAIVWTAAACQNTANNNAVAVPPDNRTAANVTRSDTANTQAPTTGDGPATPSEAYRAAYDARKNKDVPALKEVLSTELMDYLTQMGQSREDHKQTLDEILTDVCNQPQAPNGEIRAEKITGDRALVEYKDEKGKWRPMDFINENGSWKLTLPRRGEEPRQMPNQ